MPRTLVHRDAEIEALTTALDPLTSGATADDARIFGPTGAGKTTLAKYALRELDRAALDVRWAYVDCFSASTAASVYHDLCADLGRATDLRHGSTPVAEYRRRLRVIDDPVVVVLDEAAHVAGTGVFRTLYELPSLALVVIGHNEEHLFAQLEAPTASRLRTARRIYCSKYTHDELRAILDSRIEVGLRGGVVEAAAVDAIAESAAGNAREAIAILRRAVKHVQRGDADRVTPSVVGQVADEARDVLRRQNLSRLDTPHRVIYDIVRSEGPCGASTIDAAYERRLGEAPAERTRRQYVRTLVEYGLLERSGAGPATTYRAVAEPDSPTPA